MRKTPLHTKVLALVGIAALVLQLSAVPFEAFLFHLNQGFISRNLCEHKVPNCNGHCFLMKQMAKSANASKDKNAEKIGGQLDGHFLLSVLSNLTLFRSSEIKYFNRPDNEYFCGWKGRVFNPPKTA